MVDEAEIERERGGGSPCFPCKTFITDTPEQYQAHLTDAYSANRSTLFDIHSGIAKGGGGHMPPSCDRKKEKLEEGGGNNGTPFASP